MHQMITVSVHQKALLLPLIIEEGVCVGFAVRLSACGLLNNDDAFTFLNVLNFLGEVSGGGWGSGGEVAPSEGK